jgi:uncharacterized membrane protein (Fun14 family)
MALLDSIIQLITQGAIAGIPTLIVMAIPFILGLIIGFFLKKILKIAIIAAVILFVATYFGLFGLSFTGLKNLATQYGPVAIQYAIAIIGLLPLSIGLILGAILGFIFG